MSTEKHWFLERKKDRMLVKCHRLQYEIPDSYFEGGERSISTDYHGRVETLGLLNLLVFLAEDDDKPKAYSFKVPAEISLRYSSKGMIKTNKGDKIRTFSCEKEEVFMENVKVVQSAGSFYNIFKSLAVAKLTNVSYEEMVDLFLYGAKMNGINLGVNRMLLEAFVADMARSELDESIPFRVHYGEGQVGKDGFKPHEDQGYSAREFALYFTQLRRQHDCRPEGSQTHDRQEAAENQSNGEGVEILGKGGSNEMVLLQGN